MTIERALADDGVPPREPFRAFDDGVALCFHRLRASGRRGEYESKTGNWTAPRAHPEPRLPVPETTAEKNFFQFVVSLIRSRAPHLNPERVNRIAATIFAWEFAMRVPLWTRAYDVDEWRYTLLQFLAAHKIANPSLWRKDNTK